MATPTPGIELIKKFEGLRLEAYADPLTGGKPYTIGWGNTQRKDGSPFALGERISQQEAQDLLIWHVEESFLPPLQRIPAWAGMTEAQQGAILSFAYNLGAHFYGASGFETISRVLRNQQWDQIEAALVLYRNPRSNVEEGLLRRRLTEAELFLSGTPGLALSDLGKAYLSARRTGGGRLSSQASSYLAGRPIPRSTGSDQPTAVPANVASSAPRVLLIAQPYLQGEDVLAVQKALAAKGAGVVVDGVYGPATKLAVERFQQVNDLTADGIVGPQTLARLMERVLYLTTPPQQGLDVKTVQQALVKAGVNVIVDGVFGAGTQQAVKQFQLSAGLNVDGVVGPKTLKILQARPLYVTQPLLQGDDVAQVQTALQRHGGAVAVDGVYGNQTAEAVAQFQRKYGLQVDGIAGRRTLAKLLL
ncbi:MAG: peptidoglycan-binding protein [Cyanobacteria bacterium J06635_15]